MSTPDGAPKRAPVDWERVESEYRAGQLSVREIGRLHGVSYETVRRHAEAGGWIQDLSGRVRAEAAARLIECDKACDNRRDTVTSREVVDTAADRVVEIVRSHRTGIARLIRLTERLTAGMERMASGAEQQAGDAALLGSRQGVIDGHEKLAAALARLITMERQAFSIDALPVALPDGRTVEQIEAAVRARTAGLGID